MVVNPGTLSAALSFDRMIVMIVLVKEARGPAAMRSKRSKFRGPGEASSDRGLVATMIV